MAAVVEPGENAINKHLNYLGNTVYFVQSEPVKIAPDDIEEDVEGKEIKLDKFYDGLEIGRLVIVSGERTDIKDRNGKPLPGIRASELRTIGGSQPVSDSNIPGDTLHTVLTLDKPLDHTYRRSSVIVYGNIVQASHGETALNEVLGSGNAAVSLARFQLKRPPLTYVSAATTNGVQGMETIRVNNVSYRRVGSLLDASSEDRVYELTDDENGTATLIFGARLPTGQENVRASYRTGIGAEGNVKAEQISQLVSRPLGVQNVINPNKAFGGADRDGPDRIRRNAALATLALAPRSRLVSVSDYATFALQFAGIGHADARKLSGDWVVVTVAGVDDIPLAEDGELLTNLKNAYRKFGDPALQVAIIARELKAIVIQAKVVADPDADLEEVESRMRVRLLERFSFERSSLGKPVYLSDAVSVMQQVTGVNWVDVDIFGGISENELLDGGDGGALDKIVNDLKLQSQIFCALSTTSQDDPVRAGLWNKLYDKTFRFLPAQLAYLVPEVPRTLTLNLISSKE